MNPSSSLCLRAVDFFPEERASEDSDGRTLEGYAAVFDSPTEINSHEGHFTETISKGAFRKTLQERKPVLQFDHGHDARTGSVPIGMFDGIKEDKQGLKVSARLFDNPVVDPIRQAIEGGAISGMSFRFQVVRDEWKDSQGERVRADELAGLLYDAGKRGPLKRNIKEVRLHEAGPVVFPAYAGTSVGVRSISDEERESLVADYARSMQADAEQEAEIQAAAETFAEEYERDDTSEKDDAAPTGTSSEEREEEASSDDAAPFEGTSAGAREKKLRELRMQRYSE